VRISEELLPHIDKAVEESRDAFGVRRYLSRRQFVDEAVKRLLQIRGVTPGGDTHPVGVGEVGGVEEVRA